jgi:hypothetical protein
MIRGRTPAVKGGIVRVCEVPPPTLFHPLMKTASGFMKATGPAVRYLPVKGRRV